MAEARGPEERALEKLYLLLEAEAGFGLDRLPAPWLGETRDREAALRALAARAEACRACGLWRGRRRLVFGEGNPAPRLLFVGEGPGREEDRVGRPFVGRAGALLDRMIRAMGFTRGEVYIANAVKCRPPENRTPTAEEMEACRPLLEEQIRILRPRVIVALGAPAARTLLKREEGITALRGRAHPYPGDEGIPVVPTFHPAYLLRKEREKPKAWVDLQLALSLLAGTGDPGSGPRG